MCVGEGGRFPRKKMKLSSTFFRLTPFATPPPPTTTPPITTPSTTATAITKSC